MLPFEMQKRAAAHYAHRSMEIIRGHRNEWAIDPYAWDHEAGIVLTARYACCRCAD